MAWIRTSESIRDEIHHCFYYCCYFLPPYPEVKDCLMLKSRGWDLILTFSLLPFVFVVMKKVAGTAFFLNSCTCSSGMLEFNLFSPNEFITIGPEMLLFSPLLNCIFFFIIILLFFMLMWPEGWKTHVFSTVWFSEFSHPQPKWLMGRRSKLQGYFHEAGFLGQSSASLSVGQSPTSPLLLSVGLSRSTEKARFLKRPAARGFLSGWRQKP